MVMIEGVTSLFGQLWNIMAEGIAGASDGIKRIIAELVVMIKTKRGAAMYDAADWNRKHGERRLHEI